MTNSKKKIIGAIGLVGSIASIVSFLFFKPSDNTITNYNSNNTSAEITHNFTNSNITVNTISGTDNGINSIDICDNLTYFGEGRLHSGAIASIADTTTAIKHCLKASELKPSDNKYRLQLARAYIQAEKYHEAEDILKPLSDNSVPFANWFLGRLYFQGHLGKQELKKAIVLLREAANHGEILAGCDLGGVLLTTDQTMAAKNEGLKWLEQCAEETPNRPLHKQHLAEIYHFGKYNLSPNYKKAEYWYLRLLQDTSSFDQSAAAELEYDAGYLYQDKLHDNKSAAEFYTRAANKGHITSTIALVLLHHKDSNSVSKSKACTYLDKISNPEPIATKSDWLALKKETCE